MCGIAGNTTADAEQIGRMLDRISHRGPDGRGIHGVHGHVRLSLRDLSDASAQPYRRAGTVLAFNGELWNFRHLREQCMKAGWEFRTTGDTEVVAAMLSQKGLAALPEFDGMFAIAWTDRQGVTHLIRDSFGKVPLYVAKIRDGYMWASERKAFPRGIVPIAVQPGTSIRLDTGVQSRWYKLPQPSGLTERDLRWLLRQGVRERLDADAPVCCLISGGLDSALILTIAAEERPDVVAYTAVHDPASSDLKAARRLCSDLSVRLVEVPVDVSLNAIHAAAQSIEIPSKAQTEIAVLCLPLAARVYADGFRACLSGEAADELFGGYGNFCIAASKASRAELLELRAEQMAKMARGNFIRCNKAFMAAGVECRLPFMQQQLAEAAIQLDKQQSPPGKLLLKKAAEPILPSWVIKRQKETFQGASGVSSVVGRLIASPTRYFNQVQRSTLGYLPKD